MVTAHTSASYANLTLHLRNNPLSICGFTADGRPVLAGAFRLRGVVSDPTLAV